MAKTIHAEPHFEKIADIKRRGTGLAFVHITDIHLGEGPTLLRGEHKKGDDDLTSTFSNQLWTWKETGLVDFVLVSGDIADTGIRRNIQKSKHFVLGFDDINSRAPYSLWPIPFDSSNIAYMPGNHDRFKALSSGRFPTNYIFNDLFSETWPLHQWVVIKEASSDLSARKAFFVMADFTLWRWEKDCSDTEWISFRKGKIPAGMPVGKFEQWGAHLGQGEVYEDRLEYLVDATNSLRAEHQDCQIFWVVHFPPFFPGITGDMFLVGEGMLADAAEEANIAHIFSGHTHKFADYTLGNAIGTRVICSPALSKVSRRGEDTGFSLVVCEFRDDLEVDLDVVKFRWKNEKKRYSWSAI